MHPLVRDLYKRIMRVARDYPAGESFVREKAKAKFAQNAHLVDEVEIKRAVAYGRYMVREMIGVIKLRKYREMKRRYYE